MKIYGWRVPQSCTGALQYVSDGNPQTCPSARSVWWFWTAVGIAAVCGWGKGKKA